MSVLEDLWKKVCAGYNDGLMRKVVIAFFVVYFIAGAFIFRDYGVSSDENFERMTARINLDYITGKNQDLLSYSDRHYGVLFTLPLEIIGQAFPDTRDNFFFYHFATFAFFFLSTIVFYKLLRKLGYNRLLSLAGTIFLVIQPQIFAHSFFNLKDIPFLSVFIVALYTLTWFIQTRSNKAVIAHAIVTGALIVFRLPGVLMWGISAIVFAWVFVARQMSFKQFAAKFGLYMLVSMLALYAMLPVLWHNPFGEMATYLSMSPFEWDNLELFRGQYYTLAEIPQSHLFVYFGVSMPMVLLFLFGCANVIWFKDLLVDQKLFEFSSYRKVLAVAALFFTAEVFLVMRPSVYNGWRHILFVYPIFLLFVLEAIEWLWKGNLRWPAELPLRLPKLGWLIQPVLSVLLVGQMMLLLVFLAQSHPYEFTYYNWLTGRKLSNARLNYVMDYWGLSYREAFEKILAGSDADKIVVRVDDIVPAHQNWQILTPQQRARLNLIEMGSEQKDDFLVMDYIHTVFLDRKGYELIDAIKVREAVINGTYKAK